MEIALQFFVHTLKDASLWFKVLSCIQSILNNTSFSIIDKIFNKIIYSFSPRKLFDLLSNPLFPSIFQARTDIVEAMFFVLVNQKAYYNQKYQLFFMKVKDWAILKLHKGYSIPFFAGVIKKLIQQYVGPF